MTSIEQVRQGWGEDAPAWVVALAEACDERSQTRVADEIGYSAATVCYVLKGRYRGNLEAVEAAVSGALLDARHDCPVLGQVASHVCLKHQRTTFAATNPLRVRLYRACRGGCAHSQLRGRR